MPSPALHEQYASIEQQERSYRVGMWAFLSSEVLLFMTLFTIYAYYRLMYGGEFVHAIAHSDLTKGTINTFILATSTYTMTLAVSAIRRGRPVAAAVMTASTALLAVGFLAVEATEWASLIAEGAVPGRLYHDPQMPAWGAKLFFTLFFFLTGLHMLHVSAGLILLSALTLRLMMGAYSEAHYLPVELGAMYWHFVDVMWFLIWGCFYLARP